MGSLHNSKASFDMRSLSTDSLISQNVLDSQLVVSCGFFHCSIVTPSLGATISFVSVTW